MNASKNKTYKVLNSVTLPLHIYFAILGAHLAAKSVAPTVYFWRYISHIETLALEYEWPAVLEYHTLFFNQRQEEMQAGVYAHWGSPDPDLLCVHVYPHKKAIQAVTKTAKRPTTATSGDTPCRNFNAGKCDSPCAYKRPHICSSPG
ncbi:hypothetical protein B0H14DRAFT_2961949, partial [Mycena olivaceomarginata]